MFPAPACLIPQDIATIRYSCALVSLIQSTSVLLYRPSLAALVPEIRPTLGRPVCPRGIQSVGRVAKAAVDSSGGNGGGSARLRMAWCRPGSALADGPFRDDGSPLAARICMSARYGGSLWLNDPLPQHSSPPRSSPSTPPPPPRPRLLTPPPHSPPPRQPGLDREPMHVCLFGCLQHICSVFRKC